MSLGYEHLGGSAAQSRITRANHLCLAEARRPLQPGPVDEGSSPLTTGQLFTNTGPLRSLGCRKISTTPRFSFGRPDHGQRPGTGQSYGHAVIGCAAPAERDVHLLGMEHQVPDRPPDGVHDAAGSRPGDFQLDAEAGEGVRGRGWPELGGRSVAAWPLMVREVPAGGRAGRPWRCANEVGATVPGQQEGGPSAALPSRTTLSTPHSVTPGTNVCQLAGTTMLALP